MSAKSGSFNSGDEGRLKREIVRPLALGLGIGEHEKCWWAVSEVRAELDKQRGWSIAVVHRRRESHPLDVHESSKCIFPACLLSVPNHRLVSSPWFIGLLSFNAVYELLGYSGLFVFSCNLNTYGRFMWTLLNSVLHLNICWCSYNRRLSWNRITGSQVTGSPSQRFGSGREFRPGCNSGRDACITKRL